MQGPGETWESRPESLCPRVRYHQPQYEQEGSLRQLLTGGTSAGSRHKRLENGCGDEPQTRSLRPLNVKVLPTQKTCH